MNGTMNGMVNGTIKPKPWILAQLRCKSFALQIVRRRGAGARAVAGKDSTDWQDCRKTALYSSNVQLRD